MTDADSPCPLFQSFINQLAGPAPTGQPDELPKRPRGRPQKSLEPKSGQVEPSLYRHVLSDDDNESDKPELEAPDRERLKREYARWLGTGLKPRDAIELLARNWCRRYQEVFEALNMPSVCTSFNAEKTERIVATIPMERRQRIRLPAPELSKAVTPDVVSESLTNVDGIVAVIKHAAEGKFSCHICDKLIGTSKHQDYWEYHLKRKDIKGLVALNIASFMYMTAEGEVSKIVTV